MKLIGEHIILSDNAREYLDNFLAAKNYSQVFVLTDTNTQQHCLPLLELSIDYTPITIPAGDESKAMKYVEYILQELVKYGADRKSALVNLGGGMIGDLGGFCASVYQRGIDFIQVPTSLLAMVDASVGGKTGINFAGLKNYIGTFTEPVSVFVHPPFLKTLPERELKAGYVEMLKHGLIADANYFEELRTFNERRLKLQVERSIQLKYDIVQEDPYETHLRKLLNFGHTVGHAIESWSFSQGSCFLHGEAIAIGLICESFLSLAAGLSTHALEEIARTLLPFAPQVVFTENEQEEIIALCIKDKKNEKQQVQCVALQEIGKPVEDIVRNVPVEEIKKSLTYFNSLR